LVRRAADDRSVARIQRSRYGRFMPRPTVSGAVDDDALAFNSVNLAVHLLAWFPEAYGPLLQIAADNDSVEQATYSVVSVAYWWPIFDDALRDENEPKLIDCFSFLEEALGTDESLLEDALVIRVFKHLIVAEFREDIARLGGPRTKAMATERIQAEYGEAWPSAG